MSLDVFLQVVFAAKLFATTGTLVRPVARVDQLVSGQLLVSGESFTTMVIIALKWPLASVNADVILQLAVVGKGHRANWTVEVFGPDFLLQNSLLASGHHMQLFITLVSLVIWLKMVQILLGGASQSCRRLISMQITHQMLAND